MSRSDERDLIIKLIQDVIKGMNEQSTLDDSPAQQNSSNEDKAVAPPFLPNNDIGLHQSEQQEDQGLLDYSSPEAKAEILIKDPCDLSALKRMKKTTVARIGAGRCGPRLNTRTLLTLRADHASARDGVFKSVDCSLLKKLGLFSVQTSCEDKNEYLTRPDLGRTLSEDATEKISAKCDMNPEVQIFISDGLSSTAIEANVANILPILQDGLKARNIKIGTPFFVKYGRVGAMDHVSELLNATVTCVLIGERPGLATAESMSAYIAYNARVGMPESMRTVVSNIHSGGINAVEAGAYLCDVIQTILNNKASGVSLNKEV